jgi:hypothetical protein
MLRPQQGSTVGSSREKFFLEHAAKAAEEARTAQQLGYPAIAEAYRKVAALWLKMAAQQKRQGD